MVARLSNPGSPALPASHPSGGGGGLLYLSVPLARGEPLLSEGRLSAAALWRREGVGLFCWPSSLLRDAGQWGHVLRGFPGGERPSAAPACIAGVLRLPFPGQAPGPGRVHGGSHGVRVSALCGRWGSEALRVLRGERRWWSPSQCGVSILPPWSEKHLTSYRRD